MTVHYESLEQLHFRRMDLIHFKISGQLPHKPIVRECTVGGMEINKYNSHILLKYLRAVDFQLYAMDFRKLREELETAAGYRPRQLNK
jgi:hypothetical protein